MSINDNGMIAGSLRKPSGEYAAFVWDNGVTTPLGTLPGYSNSIAHAINNAGQIVGYSWNQRGVDDHAFIWEEGNFIDIGALPGIPWEWSIATDINEHGQVVGPSGSSGFLWDAINGVTEIRGSITGINDNGLVIGSGFIWKNGVSTPLADLVGPDSGWDFSTAMDANNSGEIIGVGYHNGKWATYIMTPAIYPVISVLGGIDQECIEHGGRTIEFSAGINEGIITSATWFLDGEIIGYGETVTQFVGLGSHSVLVNVVSDNGLTGEARDSINVIDTIAPQIAANIVNVKTGDTTTQIIANTKVSPLIFVTDACDPDPLVNAVAGIPTSSGDEFFIDKSRKNTSVRTDTDVDTFELSVTATDASGNTATENLELDIITR